MEHVEAASCRNYSTTSNMPLAISYVPMQEFVNVANAADGFKMGTIFEDLYLNFYCTECMNDGCRQRRYMKQTDYSNMGCMHGNTWRSAKTYNTRCNCNNNNADCSNRYNNSSTGSSNCNNAGEDCGDNCNNAKAACGNNCNNVGAGCVRRNGKRSGCRMNNWNCQA